MIVYCLTDGDHCKIGFSAKPVARFTRLQCGNPRAITVVWTRIAAVTDGPKIERYLHRHLARARKHIRGEWFAITPDQANKLLRLFDRAKSSWKLAPLWQVPVIEEGKVNDLPAYIRKYGRKTCANRFQVSLRTIDYWANGTCWPRRKTQLPRVLEASGLSIGDVYR